jgi:hypothetical protein
MTPDSAGSGAVIWFAEHWWIWASLWAVMLVVMLLKRRDR